VLGAWVFLGERVTLVMIGGGLLIMTGVVIASIRRDHGESKESADQAQAG
jgi:drug/metabolite transporter (DMT)-like permease